MKRIGQFEKRRGLGKSKGKDGRIRARGERMGELEQRRGWGIRSRTRMGE